jgi:hypothetical protein
MKKIKLFEEFINESSTWENLCKKSKVMFGEWVIDALTEEDMAKIINMKEADKLAKKIFGEFGFATLTLDDMRELINKYPKLVKESVVSESIINEAKDVSREEIIDLMETKYKIKSVRNSEDFDGQTEGIWIAADNEEELSGNKVFDYYNKGTKYKNGVLKTVLDAVEKKGWWFSWNDPGTIMIWPKN